MENIESGFWFYLEPYVYIELQKNSMLLVNMLDNTIIEEYDNNAIKLVSSTLESENCGTTFLNLSQQQRISTFISEVKNKFMGDVISTNLHSDKPVQFLPQYCLDTTNAVDEIRMHTANYRNLVTEVTIIMDMKGCSCNIIGKYTKSIVQKLTYTNLEPTMNLISIKTILNLLSTYRSLQKVDIIGWHVLDKKELSELLIICNKYTFKISFMAEINNKSFPICYNSPKVKQEIVANIAEIGLSHKLDLCDSFLKDISWAFLITSQEDIETLNDLISTYHISNYSVYPVFNGINKNFIEQLIMINKLDIVNGINYKFILLNKVINTNYFGRLLIYPNGNVASNFLSKVNENIFKENLDSIVALELKNNNSYWLMTRNNIKCNSCIWHFVCPPPSNYEYILDNPTICFRMKKL